MTPAEARALFPVLERYAYLNAGTFGPLARATAEAMAEQARRDVEDGRAGTAYFEEMFALRASIRSRLAGLLGADPESISITSSTTDGCNIVLGGLRLGQDDVVVTTDQEHPGLIGPLRAAGVRMVVAEIGTKHGEELVDAVVSAVTSQVKLVAVSHVYWTTGAVLDVHALKERTGLPVLVDGAQSVGAIPVDVGAIDFYTVSGQKWLCGPDSTGALYAADPEALDIARPSFFSYEPGTYEPRAGAARFDPGWTAYTALRGWDAALALAPEWRYDRVRELAQLARESLPRVVTAPNQSGLVAFESDDPEATVARLWDDGVVVRNLPRTPYVRASTGWWNDESDVERLVRAVGEARH